MKLSITAALLATVANAEVLQLTPDNFAELTAGKTVFLKFFAPCKLIVYKRILVLILSVT